MPMHRLWVLVSQLPPDSAVQSALSGRPGAGVERVEWTRQLHILASIQEQLQLLNYHFAAANTERGKRNPVPQPQAIPRPGIEES